MKPIRKDEVFHLSKIPPTWIGFLFAPLILAPLIVSPLIGIVSFLFWLACIYRFHTILGELSGYKYPISPLFSVGGHLLPIFNLYWIFYWPCELTHFIKSQGIVNILPGAVIGLFIFISIILGHLPGYYNNIYKLLSIIFLYSITTYIANRFKLHIENLSLKYPDGLPTVVLKDWESSDKKQLAGDDIDNKTGEKYYTTDEVSGILAVSENTVRKLLRTGKLNGVKTGRIWRVRESDLEWFLKEDER